MTAFLRKEAALIADNRKKPFFLFGSEDRGLFNPIFEFFDEGIGVGSRRSI
jgi:hypothetical protein